MLRVWFEYDNISIGKGGVENMPNYCNFDMKIKGSKNAIKRVIDCLKADYNYQVGKPTHKHMFRVFDVEDESDLVKNTDGTYTKYLYGDCAWSVFSCMCSGEHTYYNDCKKAHPDIFMGTTLEEQSKDCEIEVFSEEEGMAFSEHYLYRNGKLEIDDCEDIEIIEDSDEYEIDNPNRYGRGEDFRWTIV